MIFVTILYIAWIFSNSATPGDYSAAESGWVMEQINTLFKRLGLNFVQFSEGFVRKAAHFTEYTGLGILLLLSLSRYSAFNGKKRWRLILVGFVIALVDEGIQIFMDGRNSSILDSLLDTCGVAFGLLVCSGLKELWRRHREKRLLQKGGSR